MIGKPPHVWLFEWSQDDYESGYQAVSVHRSVKSAFKAMTKAANEEWYKFRGLELMYGKSWRSYDPLCGQSWRVRKIKLT